VSATLGSFQRMWVYSWKQSYNMPVAVLNNAHLNWNERYACFADNRISGFTNTQNDPKAAMAFKIAWSPDGEGVKVQWKDSAVAKRWLGTDHQPDTPGFVLLPHAPYGRPTVIPPGRDVMQKKYAKQLVGLSMKSSLVAHLGETVAEQSLDWLRTCATTGFIPFDYANPEADNSIVDKSMWGPAVLVGSPGHQGDFFLMKDDYDDGKQQEDGTGAEFWRLPQELQDRIDNDMQDIILQRRLLQGTPNVRYTRVSPVNARDVQEAAEARARQIRSIRQQREEQEQGSDEKDDAGAGVPPQQLESQFNEEGDVIQEKQWGADFKDCKVGWFALVHTEFDSEGGGTGLELYKIKRLCEENSSSEVESETAQCFIGTKYIPSTAGIFVTDPRCLLKKWHGSGRTEHTVRNWEVLHYLDKLNRGSTIPKKDQDAVWAKAEIHSMELFVAPKEPEHESLYELMLATNPIPGHENEDEEKDENEEDGDLVDK
jgi:hypothetical protein